MQAGMILLLALADFYPIRGTEPEDICSISRPKHPPCDALGRPSPKDRMGLW